MTRVLTCTLIAGFLTLHIVNGQLFWHDCVPDDSADLIYVHDIAISPLPIRLPGQYNVTFDATVSKTIDELSIDVEVGWKNTSSGKMQKVYPKRQHGTMRVYDGCYLINKLLFTRSPEDIARDIDVQIDNILVDTIRYHAGCPLLAGRIYIQNHIINLPMNLIAYNALRKDRYVVKILFKGTKHSSVGCVQFHVNYGGQVINK